jgi:hypothetical protein
MRLARRESLYPDWPNRMLEAQLGFVPHSGNRGDLQPGGA